MSNDLIFSIAPALHIQLDPQSTNESRRESHQFLDRILSSPEHSSSFGVALIIDPPSVASEYEQTVIANHQMLFFGLKCLEHTVLYHWDQLGEFKRAEFLSLFKKLLFECSAKLVVHHLRSKLAQIMVEIAKREWPATFDFGSVIITLYSMSNLHLEIALMAMSAISADVFNSEDHLVKQQRDVLLKSWHSVVLSPDSYKEYLETFAPRISNKPVFMIDPPCNSIGWITMVIGTITDALRNFESDSQLWSRICKYALVALASFVPWIPETELANTYNIPEIVLSVFPICSKFASASHLLASPAAELLFVYCTRSVVDPSNVYNSLFHSNCFSRLTNLIMTMANSPEFVESTDIGDCEFSDTLGLLVFSLIELANIHLCSKSNFCWIPQNFEAFLYILADVLKLKSILICSAISNVWMLMLEHPLIQANRQFIDSLAILIDTLIYILDNNSNTFDASYLAAAKTCSIKIIRTMANLYMIETFQYIYEKVVSGKNFSSSIWICDILVSSGINFPLILQYKLHYLLFPFFDTVEHESKDECRLMLCLAANSRGLHSNPDELFKLIEKLLQIALRERLKFSQTQGTALQQIVKIAKVCPSTFISLLPRLENILNSTTCGVSIKILIQESVLTAILFNTEKSQAIPLENSLAFKNICDNILVTLDASIALYATNFDDFISTVLKPFGIAEHSEKEQICQPIISIRSVLQSAEAQQKISIFYPFISQLTQVAFHLVSLCHQTWNPKLLELTVSKYVSEPRETANILTLTEKNWISSLHSTCCGLLGQITVPIFYEISDLSQKICKSMFSAPESIGNRPLSVLLNSFINKLFRNATATALDALFNEILEPLVKLLLFRLDAEWPNDQGCGANDAQFVSEMDDMMIEDKENADAEIERASALRTLTREFITFLSKLLVPTTQQVAEGMGKSKRTAIPVLTRDRLFLNSSATDTVISALLSPFRWRDSRALRKSTVVVKMLVEYLASRNAIRRLSANFLRAIIPCLLEPAHYEEQSLVIQLCQSLLAYGMSPRQTVSHELAKDPCFIDDPSIISICSQECANVLISYGIDEIKVSELQTAFNKTNDATPEKLCKELLQSIAHAPIANAGAVEKSTILSKVVKVVMKIPEKNEDSDENFIEKLFP